ncbi:DUF998 domain-containing protein [Cryobacterium sp. 10C3]|uniref:DUF998 domain-containing protein n=1 Tax=Cryobacterium sp. 10C3 TaxID=3048577 RepID=UPI002AB47E1E|nr:DUF998 domain-containing protein [Cryobacterium sp. 10C3]MDY7558926.1 DUF998 domain-containing protein [Cryobacterium sp. 10C3]
MITASAWTTPFNWSTNVISDLGNTACGEFAVHGPTAWVCSPLHNLMNASFVLTGILTIIGTILLWGLWPKRRMVTVALVLLIIAGVGKIMVGLVPEDANAALHTLGATNLTLGSVAIVLLSISIYRQNRVLAITGLIASLVGIAGGGFFATAQYIGPSATLGLGLGGIERVAGYPANLWILLIGILTIRAALADSTRNAHGSNTELGAQVVGQQQS